MPGNVGGLPPFPPPGLPAGTPVRARVHTVQQPTSPATAVPTSEACGWLDSRRSAARTRGLWPPTRGSQGWSGDWRAEGRPMACDPSWPLWPCPWGQLVLLAPHLLLNSGAPEGHPCPQLQDLGPRRPPVPAALGLEVAAAFRALDSMSRVCVSCVHTCCVCV